jgi:hypothetical protein
MLWSGISYEGLFPRQFPLFIDEWLEFTRPQGSDCRKKMYLTDDRYSKFIRIIVSEKAVIELGDDEI